MSRSKQINVLPSMRDWWERNKPRPAEKPAKSEKVKPVRTTASELELAAIKAIHCVAFPVGVGSKRFARDMQGATELTDGQRDFLWGIVWRYRRQIEDENLVEHARLKASTNAG